jgi:hypothetical protein
MFDAVCFRQWRSLPSLCKSSCLCNQRRWSCSRPGPYSRFSLWMHVYLFPHQPWFGGKRQDCSTCSRHRHAQRRTQLGGRQGSPGNDCFGWSNHRSTFFLWLLFPFLHDRVRRVEIHLFRHKDNESQMYRIDHAVPVRGSVLAARTRNIQVPA